MSGCDGKISAKLRTGAPCGNDDKSGRSSSLEVAESIWYSGYVVVDSVNDDMNCDANASRSFHVTRSSPLFDILVEFVNQLLDQLSFLDL